MSKWKPLVTRYEGTAHDIEIREPDGDYICLSWVEAARVMGELQQLLQDYDLECQAQRELEARTQEMIAVTATLADDRHQSGEPT